MVGCDKILSHAANEKKSVVLLGLAMAGAAAKYGGRAPRVVEKRLAAEWKIIMSREYHTEAFLIVRDFISAALNAGLMAVPDTQTGSSAILYFLGATGVNPLAPHYYCASPGCYYFEKAPTDGALCGYDLAAKMCPKCSVPLEKDGFGIPYETLLMSGRTGHFCLMFSAEPAAYKILTEKAVEKFCAGGLSDAVTTCRDSFSGKCETTTIHFDKFFGLHKRGNRFRLVITEAKERIINPGPAIIAYRVKNLSWPVLHKPECAASLGDRMIDAGKALMAVFEDSACAGGSKFNFVFRDDIFAYLLEKGVDRDTALAVSETVRKGKWSAAAPELKSELKKAGCAPEVLEEFSAIKYLPTKASGAIEAILASYEHH